MSEFERENRYIVIKRSDLKKVPVAYRPTMITPMFNLLPHLPARECLVIESDWPEYEFAWSMIEDRVLGKLTKQESAVSAFSQWYASGSYDELSTATAALMAFKQGVAYALNSGSYKP